MLGWYIVLETGSVMLLTLMASLAYAGTLVAPLFGVVGDRMGLRDLLGFVRSGQSFLCSPAMACGWGGF